MTGIIVGIVFLSFGLAVFTGGLLNVLTSGGGIQTLLIGVVLAAGGIVVASWSARHLLIKLLIKRIFDPSRHHRK